MKVEFSAIKWKIQKTPQNKKTATNGNRQKVEEKKVNQWTPTIDVFFAAQNTNIHYNIQDKMTTLHQILSIISPNLYFLILFSY